MPRYRVNQTSFIDGGLREEGDEVEYDHAPGHNLDPICAEAKKRKKAFLETDEGQRAAPGDAGFISQLMAGNGDPLPGGAMIPGRGASSRRRPESIYGSDSSAPSE